MKASVTLPDLMASMPALACKGGLLDQEFRRLASTEVVNLCKAYAGNPMHKFAKTKVEI